MLRHYSLFHGNINKPPIHEAFIIIFVDQPNFSSRISEDKWWHQLDTKINIQNMILPMWDKFCFPSHWALTCFDYRHHPTSVLAFWCLSVSVSTAPAEVWLPSLLNASLVYTFCSYSESYGVLFQALIGHVTLPVVEFTWEQQNL